MDISVVIVTYNRSSMINQIVSDILQQTFSNYEFLIINNGSTDNTHNILAVILANEERVRVIELSQEVSVGAARNIGIRNACGKYITFVDDDDRVSTDYLESLLCLIRDHNADMSIVGIEEEVDGVVQPQIVFDGIIELSGEEAVEELVKRRRIRAGLPCKMFKKELLLKYPIYEDSRHEDVWSTFRYLADSSVVAMDGKARYRAVRHGDNLSSFNDHGKSMSKEQMEEYLAAYTYRRDWLNSRFPNKKPLWDYSVWSFEISMCRRCMEDGTYSTNPIAKEMAEDLAQNRHRIFESLYLTPEERNIMNKCTKIVNI